MICDKIFCAAPRYFFAAAGLAMVSVLLAACAKEPENTSVFTPVDFPQWEKEVASYRGKILVVDAWATWCEPCLERFPHMVELDTKYRQQNVQFVSLNLDDKNSAADIALAESFITKMNADFPHYFMNENMMSAFKKLDFLSIPVVLVYDQHGEKRFKLSGDNPNAQFTDADVENAIISLLSEGSQNS